MRSNQNNLATSCESWKIPRLAGNERAQTLVGALRLDALGARLTKRAAILIPFGPIRNGEISSFRLASFANTFEAQ